MPVRPGQFAKSRLQATAVESKPEESSQRLDTNKFNLAKAKAARSCGWRDLLPNRHATCCAVVLPLELTETPARPRYLHSNAGDPGTSYTVLFQQIRPSLAL